MLSVLPVLQIPLNNNTEWNFRAVPSHTEKYELPVRQSGGYPQFHRSSADRPQGDNTSYPLPCIPSCYISRQEHAESSPPLSHPQTDPKY